MDLLGGPQDSYSGSVLELSSGCGMQDIKLSMCRMQKPQALAWGFEVYVGAMAMIAHIDMRFVLTFITDASPRTYAKVNLRRSSKCGIAWVVKVWPA